MKSGTLFDNVLVTDDPEYAKQFAEETWGKQKDVSWFVSIVRKSSSTVSQHLVLWYGTGIESKIKEKTVAIVIIMKEYKT